MIVMNVRAPATGLLKVILKRSGPVKKGDRLAVFDSTQADVEIAKAESSLTLLRNAQRRLITFIGDNSETGGLLTDMRTVTIRTAQEAEKSYQLFLEDLQLAYKLGTIDNERVLQAEFFLKASQSLVADEKSALQKLRMIYKEGDQIFKLLISYATDIKEREIRRKERLNVSAPFDGILDMAVINDGYIVAGSILATYRSHQALQPRLIVTAPASGIIERHDIPDGEVAAVGQSVLKIDTEEEIAHLAQLDLLELQLQLIRNRLQPESLELKRDALRLRVDTIVAQRVLQEEIFLATKMRWGTGMAGHQDLMAAQGAFNQASVAETKAKAEAKILDIAIAGLKENIVLYEQLVNLERNVIQARVAKKTISAKISGSVQHYVSLGSFVSAGTPIFGIL